MSVKIRLGAIALVCGAVALTPVAFEPARAQGLLQGLFGQPSYAPPPPPPPGYYSGRNDRWGSPSRRTRSQRYQAPFGFGSFWGGGYQGPPPTARVSSPRYYTYEADALEVVSFADLAEVETASNSPLAPDDVASPFAEAGEYMATIEMRLLPEVGAALKAHYTHYPELLWSEDGTVNARAYSALAGLERADRYGLSARDYVVDMSAFSFNAGNARDKANTLIEFDLELSAAILTYVLDANRGRVDPNRISGYHDFARKEIDLADALLKIAATEDVGTYIEQQHPDNAPFAALVEELARLRASGEAPRIEIAPGTFLRPGESSPELANIVAAIGQAGSPALLDDYSSVLDGYAGTPEFGPELVDLVKAYQREHGLVADGVVGPNTIRAMVPDSNADRIAKVELAMERLRWLPRDLGARHVIINQPAYTATYMHEGRDPLSMRVVVGTKSNQTYFFADKVEIVEYNPYWGVPKSIIVNEMLPQLYQDPSYLDRAGYEVTTSTGQRVSSSSVNWGAVAADQMSVDVRQPPGASNALGRVKILFPNAHAIYMHDTPQRHLFERDTRAFSHGCVRLHQPREMAAAVLDQTVEYIDQRIAEGQNAQEEVTADISVYVSYFTAWPTPDGTVEYYDDVYERDMYLTRAIDRTNSVRHAEG